MLGGLRRTRWFLFTHCETEVTVEEGKRGVGEFGEGEEAEEEGRKEGKKEGKREEKWKRGEFKTAGAGRVITSTTG